MYLKSEHDPFPGSIKEEGCPKNPEDRLRYPESEMPKIPFGPFICEYKFRKIHKAAVLNCFIEVVFDLPELLSFNFNLIAVSLFSPMNSI